MSSRFRLAAPLGGFGIVMVAFGIAAPSSRAMSSVELPFLRGMDTDYTGVATNCGQINNINYTCTGNWSCTQCTVENVLSYANIPGTGNPSFQEFGSQNCGLEQLYMCWGGNPGSCDRTRPVGTPNRTCNPLVYLLQQQPY